MYLLYYHILCLWGICTYCIIIYCVCFPTCRLAVPGCKVTTSESIKSVYILDCAEQNKLLSLNKYRYIIMLCT